MTEYKVCGLETLSTTRAEEIDYEKDYTLMKEIIAKIKKYKESIGLDYWQTNDGKWVSN